MSFGLAVMCAALFVLLCVSLTSFARFRRAHSSVGNLRTRFADDENASKFARTWTQLTRPEVGDVVLDTALVGVLGAALLLWSAVFAVLADMPFRAGATLALSAAGWFTLGFSLLPGHWRARVLGALLVALSGVVLADVIYWRFFDALMPVAASQSAGLAFEVTKSVVAFLERRDLLVVAFLLGGLPLFFWPKSKLTSWKWTLAPRAALFAVAALVAIPSYNDVAAWMAHRKSWKVFGWDAPVAEVGVVQAHVRDVARTWREAKFRETFDADKIASMRSLNALHHVSQDTAKRDPMFGVAKGMNVLVIQVEALQHWVIDQDLEGRSISPTFNAAAHEGLYFDHIWDVTGGSSTSDCEYAALNSQYPLAQGAVAFRRPANKFMAFPSVLRESGYATISGHANRPRMWNRGIVHPAWGFETSWWKDDFTLQPKYGWGLADHAFMKQIATKLATTTKRPFLGYFLTLTSHHPYTYLPSRERVFKKRLGSHIEEYASSMRYVDKSFKVLLEALERDRLLENTLIVVYGDHDSKLTFSKQAMKNAQAAFGWTKEDARSLAKRQWRTKRIPLIFLLPHQSRAVLDRLRGVTEPAAVEEETADDGGVEDPDEHDFAPDDEDNAEEGDDSDADGGPFADDGGPSEADGGPSETDDVVIPAVAKAYAGEPKTISTIGSQVDFAPTLLHYLGLEIPKAYIGRALLDGQKGFAVRFDGAAVDDNLVYEQAGRRCLSHAGKRLAREKCHQMKLRGETLLERSWKITLSDLATRLSRD